MKTFIELYIRLEDSSPDTFFKLVEQNLSENWSHKKIELDEALLDDTPISCYQYSKNKNLPGAFLYLIEKETSLLYVSNIIPTETGRLSYDEYNAILTDFSENVIKNIQEKINVSAEMTKPEITINDILSSECSELFKAFSVYANKSTGSSHPADQKRWFSFIKCVDKSSEKIDPDIVQKLLIDDSWPEDEAIELSLEFEFAISLLKFHHEAEECHA